MKRFPLTLALLALTRVALAAPPAVEATDAIRREASWLMMEDDDLAISTPTALRQTIGLVETFFSTPLAFPVTASQWADTVEPATDLGTLFVLTDNLLGKSAAVDPGVIAWEPPEPVPPSARAAIKNLVSAISAAQPYLNRAVASVRSDDRAAFAAMYGWPVNGAPPKREISSRRIRRPIEAMKSYDDGAMRTAGGLVLMAVDDAIEMLRDTIYYVPRPVRFESPVGDIVIGGNGPDIYTRHDLDNAVIVVDFGGRNTYVGPVAFAKPGETRVSIDLGTSVEVRAEGDVPGAVGASLFGIAVMAMPNDLGVKRLTTGPWSLGATVGGVAACLTAGRVQADSGRYSQGTGIYGLGIFNAGLAAESVYTAAGYAQGAGGIRGLGIFRHQGDNAKLSGGLTEPDPREDGGAVSLCQGVGFGPRAYAGGGIGICTLSGDGISALASYFAQGAGYWHAAGVFRLRGNSGTIQGRRYALGAGVHSAFGHFEALGNGNRLLNWGVGPAYGWDRGVGSAIVMGDGVEVQADWGIGAAEVGGRAFGYYRVNSGKFKVPGIGRGGFLRNESAHSIQILNGVGNSIEGFGDVDSPGDARVMKNPWGLFRTGGAAFVTNLGLAPPVWPLVDRAAALEEQTVDLQAELSGVKTTGTRETVSAIADIAGAFSLDKETPRQALQRLLSLSADDAKFLVDALEPSAVEQSIPILIAIGARGAALTKQVYAVKAYEKGLVCTSLLRLSRPSVAISYLENRANGKDAAWSAAALRALGFIMNTDDGEEAGIRVTLGAVHSALEKDASAERALSLLRRLRFPEAIALLATCASIGPEERLELLAAGPDDLTDRLGGPGAGKFMDIVGRNPNDNRDRIRKEISYIDKERTSIRKLVEKKSRSRDATVMKAALIAAGQIGGGKEKDREGNAAWVEKFLTHERGDLREAAAVALGRMGDAGLPALRRASGAQSARTRALAAFGAGHATSAGAETILSAALSDNSPNVVMMAAAVIANPPPALYDAIPALKKKAARRLSQTTSRDLKLQLKLLK